MKKRFLLAVCMLFSFLSGGMLYAEESGQHYLLAQVNNSAALPGPDGLPEDEGLKTIFLNYDITLYSEVFPGAKNAALQDVYELHFRIGDAASLTTELQNSGFYSGIETLVYEETLGCSFPYSPNDPYQYLNNWALTEIEAECAWSITQGSSSISIGIADTEFESTHEDLGQITSEWGYANPNACPHGTLVAGCASAKTNNGIGISGIGYNSKIKGYHVPLSSNNCSGSPWSAVWQAYLEGNDVINVSWTGVGGSGYTLAAVHEIVDNGTVLVVAAGNTPNGQHHFAYADYPGVIMVSGVDMDNKHGPTNHAHNSKVDLCAPSINVTTTYLNDSYGGGWGTSFAAPMVSGTVALMLSVNPCLTPREIEMMLKSSCDAIADGSSFPGTVGAGRLNAYEAVKLAAGNAPVTYISTNTTWSGERFISENVIVQNGATLTVTGTVYMHKDAQIRVNVNGLLNVDGGKLTSGDCMWKGVRVDGTYSASQYPVSGVYSQGRAFVKNGGTIENAEVGISTTSGGIIQTSNAYFLNNEVDAQLQFFTNTYPSNAGSLAGQPTNDLSYFRSTEFKTTEVLNNGNGHPDKHLIFSFVDGIRVTSCTFENTLTSLNANILKRGYGIYADHSGFTVQSTCTSIPQLGSPCSNYDKSKFKGLAYGISGTSSNPMHDAIVKNSEFENNWRGVYINGMDHSSITRNTFEISEPPGWTWPHHPNEFNYGVYIRGAIGFEVEENDFSTTTEAHYGIMTASTNYGLESTEDIYKNTFDGINTATAAYHKNDGLLIKCNEYYNTLGVNIVVESYNGSIANPQGTCTNSNSAAGNYFDNPNCTSTGIYDIWNDQWPNISYNHHTTPMEYTPNCTWNANVNDCGFAYNANNCASQLDYYFSQDVKADVRVKRIQHAEDMHDLVSDVRLIDGGNTTDLLDEISNQADPNVLIGLLDGASPYLSDEVLLAMVRVPNSLSEGDLTNLLVANSSLTDSIMDSVRTMTPALRQSNLTSIENAQTGTSQRIVLEETILTKRRDLELLTSDVIRDYNKLGELTDTIYKDSIITFLTGIGDIEEEGVHSDVSVRLAYTYMAKGDYTSADLILADYETLVDKNSQSEILRMEIGQLQNGLTMLDVDSADSTILVNLAMDKSKNGFTSAKSMLATLSGTLYPEEFSPVNTSASPRKKSSIADEEKTTDLFNVYPNPFNQNFILETKQEANFSIRLLNLQGQLIFERENIPAGVYKKEFDLSSYAKGMYLIQVASPNGVKTMRVVKQ